MAKDPAFLFYSSDFLNGVTDLNMEERGQYITLLCIQHQKGVLTDKTIRLSVGSASVDVLDKFIKDENGNYSHQRLNKEIENRLRFTESRRNNGMKGGRPPKTEKPNGYPNGKPTDNRIEDEDENDNTVFNKTYTVFYEKAKNLFPTANDERRMLIAKKLAQRYSLDEVNDIDALVTKYMRSKI